MPKSFAELEKTDGDAAVLIDTMRDYAESGASISDQVAIEIIKRTPLTPDQRRQLRQYAQAGFENQDRRREGKAASEYKAVVDYLDRS